jgi:predicted metal-binding membrane protein
MIAPSGAPTDRSGLGPAFSAVRTQRGIVVLLVVLAAVGWWWTADQMRGMDNGPWSDLGTFGWFVSVWVVMMAAMMFPSVAPTVALYARMTGQRSSRRPLVFVAGYLLTWTVAGLAAFVIKVLVDAASGHVFAWDHAGRWVAGTALLVAAVYQFTPLKNVCLAKCRSPLGLLLGTWREGNSGALAMGAKNGAWCVGCCWALMVALFALGIMSLGWMALVAVLITLEKMLPWPRVALYGTAAILVALGLLVLVAPSALPGLTTPSKAPMQEMHSMN